MNDPPIVSQDELLQLIGELEGLCADLSDGNAGVSAQLTEKLQRLRAGIVGARPSLVREFNLDLAREIFRVLAAEVVKRVIETLISHQLVLGISRARERTYRRHDRWRMHQNPSRVGWAQAA